MKTFISIGTGPGMGFATAERFAKEGYAVVLAARSADKVRDLASQLTAKGFTAEATTIDTSDTAAVEALVADVKARHGSVDVVHYNAASKRESKIGDQPSDTFVSDLATNIGGAMAAAKAAEKAMATQGAGSILLTGGGFALAPSPDYISLSIGKAGIRALALGLFEDFKTKGIHVATVTVSAWVSPASDHATAVAEHFWQLHNEKPGSWTNEVQYA
ncbi:SDR family NAD(P)-dependent oxidoreductase [Hyphomicrobium sp.]|uniref:SDR family NAD(P)-dependent oxidoreductase n=1 Tax=Hyphomicrobium sp. TaxID=82 RepID=UPI003F6EE7CB